MEDPEGARRTQEQRGATEDPGGARRTQEDPGGSRRSQGDQGRARRSPGVISGECLRSLLGYRLL